MWWGIMITEITYVGIKMDLQILSKCCNSTIRTGRFESWCCECGFRVNPENGIPYTDHWDEHPENDEYQPNEEEIHNYGGV